MSVVAKKVIAAFESLPAEEKKAVANEILRRLPLLNRGSQTGDQIGLAGNQRAALLESELSAMAADPEIQRELCRIHSEFGTTEADGLGSA
jgi:hypothetical protein